MIFSLVCVKNLPKKSPYFPLYRSRSLFGRNPISSKLVGFFFLRRNYYSMAVEICSENNCSSPTRSSSSSPRISFSTDLHNTVESSPLIPPLLQSDCNDDDFDFSISLNFDSEPSPADELFLNGLIRPLYLLQETSSSFSPAPKQSRKASSTPPPLPGLPTSSGRKQEPPPIPEAGQQKVQTKPFWRFGRSSSVHFDSSASKKSSFWSFSILTRSKSTGSVLSSKQTSKGNNNNQRHNKYSKNLVSTSSLSSSSSSSSFSGFWASSQKPPLKRNHGNGIRISSVLNVPPPCIINKGTANLFGLGSLFGNNGKWKPSKK